MDKNTFGNTPAAIYLTKRLDELNNKKFTRKISKVIHEVQTMVSELREAHDAGVLSTHTISFMTFKLEEKAVAAANALMGNHDQEVKAVYETPDIPDQLAVNLMLNLLKGDLKCMRNQAQKVKWMEVEQSRVIENSKKGRTPVLHFAPGVDPKPSLIGWDTGGFIPIKIKLSSVQEATKNPVSLQVKSRKRLYRLNKKCDFY